MSKKIQSTIAVLGLLSFSSLMVGCANTSPIMNGYSYKHQTDQSSSRTSTKTNCIASGNTQMSNEYTAHAVENVGYGFIYGGGIVLGAYATLLLLFAI